MRKFRIFDNVIKQYFESEVIEVFLDQKGELVFFNKEYKNFWCDKSDRYTVEESTGKFDKNGKEIYQADIIDCGNWHGKKEVLFENGAFKIKGKYGQKVGFLSWAKNVEIIGNIHGGYYDK